MYLKSVTIKRLKRLRAFRLDLTDQHGEPRRWTIIIGENGTAKSSILQAIAMAAAGGSQVNTVADRTVRHLRDRRTNHEPLEVQAEFQFSERSQQATEVHPHWPSERADTPTLLRSSISLQPGSTTIVGKSTYLADGQSLGGEDPLDHARSVHAHSWFVAAYGVARALPDSAVTPDLSKASIERLKPLFDHRVELASVGFANHFVKRDLELGRKKGATSRYFSKVLNQIITLGGNDLLPDIDKLELRGHGGAASTADLIDSDRFQMRMGAESIKIAGVAVSHGYQSTFAWISDLVGHILLEADSRVAPKDMEGLVLLDEIDLYLHPKWQRGFARALRRVFPKIQFIATTHSPVVLAGLHHDEIVRLAVDPTNGDIQQVVRHPQTGDLVPIDSLVGAPSEPDPRLMTGTELYEDYFGIHTLTLNPHGELLRAYTALAGDAYRTDRQHAKLLDLAKQLKAANVDELMAPVPRERAP